MNPHTASEERGEQKTLGYMLLKSFHQVQNLVVVRQVQYVVKILLKFKKQLIVLWLEYCFLFRTLGTVAVVLHKVHF